MITLAVCGAAVCVPGAATGTGGSAVIRGIDERGDAGTEGIGVCAIVGADVVRCGEGCVEVAVADRGEEGGVTVGGAGAWVGSAC